MSKELFRDTWESVCIPVLLQLAKRKNPKNIKWFEWITGKCHVCNMINHDISINEMIDHGMMHLKEHNLLPFI